MDPGTAAQVSALMGAGAGMLAKGAGGEAGKLAVDRVLSLFRRHQPEEADQLATVLAELGVLAEALGDAAGANAELAEALSTLARQAKAVDGINIEVGGGIGKQTVVHGDVGHISM